MNRQDMEDKLAQLQGRIQTPKVAAILQKLREIRHAEPDAKAVIFGQWKGTQDMVAKVCDVFLARLYFVYIFARNMSVLCLCLSLCLSLCLCQTQTKTKAPTHTHRERRNSEHTLQHV